MYETEAAQPPVGPKRRAKAANAFVWVVIGLALVTLAGLGVKAGMLLADNNTNALIPAEARANASFPLYQPSPLPDGYTIKAGGVRYANPPGMLTIPIEAVSGHQMVMTQQALPKALTFEELRGQGKTIEGVPGEAAVSNVEGRNVASMITRDRKTLIILNTTNATEDELVRVMKSLKPLE
jgi:hypothetical protein